VALADWMMTHAELGLESLPPDQRWRRAYWYGRAYEVLGLLDEATGAYEAAERALEQRVRRLDFDTAREGLLLGHQPSAQRLVELLVSRGRVEGALCVARRARRRMDVLLDRTTVLSTLDEPRRERWREALTRVREAHEPAGVGTEEQVFAAAAQRDRMKEA